MRILEGICPEQHAWRNHPSIYRWCTKRRPLKEIEAENFLDSVLHDKSQHHFVGYIPACAASLKVDSKKSAEFSIMVDPDNFKKGYGFEILQSIIKYGFNCLELKKIWGKTRTENRGARRLFKKCGLREYRKTKKWVWIKIENKIRL